MEVLTMRLEELSPLKETDAPVYSPLYLKSPEELPWLDLRTRLVLVGLGLIFFGLAALGLMSSTV